VIEVFFHCHPSRRRTDAKNTEAFLFAAPGELPFLRTGRNRSPARQSKQSKYQSTSLTRE
jgi:hypothetical protein